MTVEPIAATTAISSADPIITSLGSPTKPGGAETSNGFADILTKMAGDVDAKITEANDLVREFAVNDDVPVHKVTFALEEARLSVELMMQVRTRLVEGYRQIMNMQM